MYTVIRYTVIMNSIIKATVFNSIVLISNALISNTASAAQNVVLVTLDGVRWQEVFSGADKNLINNADFVKNPTQLNKQFWAPTANKRQQLLMPFLTQHVAKKGVIVGDRAKGSNMSVSNPWYFSYPGYNEILTGEVDEKINSNNKVLNANKTILERLDERADFRGKTALFGSWDVCFV